MMARPPRRAAEPMIFAVCDACRGGGSGMQEGKWRIVCARQRRRLRLWHHRGEELAGAPRRMRRTNLSSEQ